MAATDGTVRGARASSSVTQAQLDVQDGTVLLLMDELMAVFNAEHAANPAVPALLPNATRSYFLRQAAAPEPPAGPAPAPTPPV